MNVKEIRDRLETEPDFIVSKRFDNSLAKMMERYPDGAPTKLIARALMLSEVELEELEASIIVRVREKLGVTLD